MFLKVGFTLLTLDTVLKTLLCDSHNILVLLAKICQKRILPIKIKESMSKTSLEKYDVCSHLSASSSISFFMDMPRQNDIQ